MKKSRFTEEKIINGPELISEALEKWAERHGIERRFNRTYREEVRDCYVFETLTRCDGWRASGLPATRIAAP